MKPRLLLPVSLAFAALLGGCEAKKAARGAGGPPVTPVQVATAERRSVPRRQPAIGTVQALRTVAVKSQVDGVIASVHFREGDDVQVGDLLVTLDRRPFENSLRMARADLTNAKAEATRASSDAERYGGLDRESAISKEQYNQLLTRAETTKGVVQLKEAAVANAELQLSYAEIRAPIAGRTGQLNFHEGALVKANDANSSLVTINQLAPIAVGFGVPERLLDDVRAALAVGKLTVQVHGRDDSDVRTAGKVEFIDNAVDPTTGMILLKAAFPNADRALWPGRFVDVELELGADADQIVVPTSAVQIGQNGPQIFVVKADKTVELRRVKVQRTAGDSSLIASGIAAGETVVTDGQFRLVPGAKVEPRTLGAPGDPAPAKREAPAAPAK